jgi:hypothetical protein
MLALGHAARFAGLHRESDGHQHEGRPLSASYIGRFKGRLAGHNIAYIQRRAESLMPAFGYAPEPIDLSPGGRLLCDLVTPVAATLARLAAGIGQGVIAQSGIYR